MRKYRIFAETGIYEFEGRELFMESSTHEQASPYYSGKIGRWQEFTLYKTPSGRYVGVVRFASLWPSERDRYYLAYSDTLQPIKELVEAKIYSDELKDRILERLVNMDESLITKLP